MSMQYSNGACLWLLTPFTRERLMHIQYDKLSSFCAASPEEDSSQFLYLFLYTKKEVCYNFHRTLR